jgi:ABC-type glycerol-3-phosphate transport system substrate-binding protein
VKSRAFISLWLIILIMLLLLLVACGAATETAIDPGTTGVPSDDAVTILFACHENYESLFSQYKEFARQFEEQNPNIKVQLVNLDESLGAGNETTLVFSEDSWQRIAAAADTSCMPANPEATRQGLVRDLTPFIETNLNFHPEDFYPHTLESFQWDGGTWSIPHKVNFQFVFYHKTAFDIAGTAYPEPGWTWDDFLEKAIALTEREGNEIKRWGVVQPQRMDFILSLVQGHLIDNSTTPPELLFNSSPVVEAVRWYTDLHLKHQVMPFIKSSEERAAFQPHLLAEEGTAAMWTGLFLRSQWWWQKDLGLGVVPYPVNHSQGTTTPISIWPAYTMSAGTVHPKESWLWLDFLSRQSLDGSEGELPARRSVAETTKFWEDLDEELVPVYRFALEHSLFRDRNISKAMLTHFYDAVETVLEGKQEVKAALAEAQIESNQILAEQVQGLTRATPQAIVVATPAPEIEERMTITFSPLLASAAVYRDLAQTFHSTHPDITVNVQRPDFSGGFDLETMNTSADCFEWFPVSGSGIADYVLDLDPFLEAYPDFSLDDFYPQTLNVFRQRGGLWALPAAVELSVVYYNQDLFDTAEVAYPQPGWDPDEFLTKARSLTQGEEDERQYGYLPLDGDASDFFTFLSLQDIFWVVEQGNTVHFRLSDPSVIEALRWYIDLDQIHNVKPVFAEEDPARSETVAWEKRQNLVETSKAAMWIDTISSSSTSKPEGARIGIAPLPVGQNETINLFVYGYYISKDTSYPQQCWQWIRFLSQQNSEVMHGLPARRSVAESTSFQTKVGEEVAEVYLFSVEHSQDMPRILTEQWTWPGYQWLRRAYGEVAQGATPEAALAEAQHKAEVYYTCLEGSQGFADEALQKSCAEKADPDFQWSGEMVVRRVER